MYARIHANYYSRCEFYPQCKLKPPKKSNKNGTTHRTSLFPTCWDYTLMPIFMVSKFLDC